MVCERENCGMHNRPSSNDVFVTGCKFGVVMRGACSRSRFLPQTFVLVQVMEAGIVMTRMMLVVVSNLMQLQAPSNNNWKQKTLLFSLSPNIESYKEALNFGIVYILSMFILLSFCAFALLHVF